MNGGEGTRNMPKSQLVPTNGGEGKGLSQMNGGEGRSLTSLTERTVVMCIDGYRVLNSDSKPIII